MIKEINKIKEPPLVITYTNLLHTYGIDSQEAENFKEKYKDDKVFQRRARTLDYLIKHKDRLLEDLE